MAASFQATVVKMLVRQTVRAALRLGVKRVVLTGGVAANAALRAALAAECREHGHAAARSRASPLHRQRRHDRDGGPRRLAAGERAPLTLNAQPDLALA